MASVQSKTTKVQHSYKDHAHADESKADADSQRRDLKADYHRSDRNFPVKLHYMLSELEKEGLSHVVSWQPHGRCFLVHDHKEFVERILPL
jgi:HSF-type DNA-binding